MGRPRKDAGLNTNDSSFENTLPEVINKAIGLSTHTDGRISVDVVEYNADGTCTVTSRYVTSERSDAMDRVKILTMQEL